MSGDSAGFIFGAAVAVPLVAVAGAGLVAYGAAKALYFCGKGCVELYKHHKEKVQLKLESTNAEIDKFYKTLDVTLASISDANIAAAQRAETELKQAAEELQINVKGITVNNVAAVVREINAGQTKFFNDFQTKISLESKNNLAVFNNSLSEMQHELKKQLLVSNKISDFIDDRERRRAIVKGKAAELITQAETELKSIKNRDTHNLISDYIRIAENQLVEAKSMLTTDANDAALATASDVLCQIASLASRLAYEEELRWQDMVKVYNCANTLYYRLEKTEYLEIENPATKTIERFNMDDYTRGNHGDAMEDLANLINNLKLAMDIKKYNPGQSPVVFSSTQLDLLYQKLLNETTKKVDAIIDEGIRRIGDYCEKLKCANTIIEGLGEKSAYQDQWIAFEGDDPTGPLVIHLKNNAIGDEVSIRLDDCGRDGVIDIQAYDFMPNDAMINEKYREDFREMINNIISAENGYESNLSCVGNTKHKNSTHLDYNNKTLISEMPLQKPTKLPD